MFILLEVAMFILLEVLRRRQVVERMQAALTAAGHRQFTPDSSETAALRQQLRVPGSVRDEAITRLKSEGLLPDGWRPRR